MSARSAYWLTPAGCEATGGHATHDEGCSTCIACGTKISGAAPDATETSCGGTASVAPATPTGSGSAVSSTVAPEFPVQVVGTWREAEHAHECGCGCGRRIEVDDQEVLADIGYGDRYAAWCLVEHTRVGEASCH